ncbi:hypothetical protein ACHAP8_011999 [Fusarium lateritium]
MTGQTISKFNHDITWAWSGCDNLVAGTKICLSSGKAPMPNPIKDAVCGPQAPGAHFRSDIKSASDFASANPCPLNACCSVNGRCGVSTEFCTKTNPLDLSHCISNCGTSIQTSNHIVKNFLRIVHYDPTHKLDAFLADDPGVTHIHWPEASISKNMTITVNHNHKQWREFTLLDHVSKIVSFGDIYQSTDDLFNSNNRLREVMQLQTRQQFVSQLVKFVDTSGIDGVHFDWQIRQLSSSDTHLYLVTLRELRRQLSHKYSISISLPSQYSLLKAYPVRELASVVDYFVYLTHEIYEHSDLNSVPPQSGCPAGNCLRSHINQTEVEYALSMITKAGVNSKQVVVGEAGYGRAFTNVKPRCHGPDCFFKVDISSAEVPANICSNSSRTLLDSQITDSIDQRRHKAITWYDKKSASDFLILDDMFWVSYASESTRKTRAENWRKLGFLGTAGFQAKCESKIPTSGQDTHVAPNPPKASYPVPGDAVSQPSGGDANEPQPKPEAPTEFGSEKPQRPYQDLPINVPQDPDDNVPESSSAIEKPSESFTQSGYNGYSIQEITSVFTVYVTTTAGRTQTVTTCIVQPETSPSSLPSPADSYPAYLPPVDHGDYDSLSQPQEPTLRETTRKGNYPVEMPTHITRFSETFATGSGSSQSAPSPSIPSGSTEIIAPTSETDPTTIGQPTRPLEPGSSDETTSDTESLVISTRAGSEFLSATHTNESPSASTEESTGTTGGTSEDPSEHEPSVHSEDIDNGSVTITGSQDSDTQAPLQTTSGSGLTDLPNGSTRIASGLPDASSIPSGITLDPLETSTDNGVSTIQSQPDTISGDIKTDEVTKTSESQADSTHVGVDTRTNAFPSDQTSIFSDGTRPGTELSTSSPLLSSTETPSNTDAISDLPVSTIHSTESNGDGETSTDAGLNLTLPSLPSIDLTSLPNTLLPIQTDESTVLESITKEPIIESSTTEGGFGAIPVPTFSDDPAEETSTPDDCLGGTCTVGKDCNDPSCTRGGDCFGPNCTKAGACTGPKCTRGGQCQGEKCQFGGGCEGVGCVVGGGCFGINCVFGGTCVGPSCHQGGPCSQNALGDCPPGKCTGKQCDDEGDEDCTSKTTAEVCTETVSSTVVTTIPTTSWSTTTKTSCRTLTECDITDSTITTTMTGTEEPDPQATPEGFYDYDVEEKTPDSFWDDLEDDYDEWLSEADRIPTTTTTTQPPTTFATSTKPRSTVTVTAQPDPTPEAKCYQMGETGYYKFEISDIFNLADDGGAKLKKEETGCGAITDWDWQSGDNSNLGHMVFFNLPLFIKSGCVERAIVSAGGPKINCKWRPGGAGPDPGFFAANQTRSLPTFGDVLPTEVQKQVKTESHT